METINNLTDPVVHYRYITYRLKSITLFSVSTNGAVSITQSHSSRTITSSENLVNGVFNKIILYYQHRL